MKYFFYCLFFLFLSSFHPPVQQLKLIDTIADSTGNIFIITLDGFRWQELFKGADNDIMDDPAFTSDQQMMKGMYGGESPGEKRKKLLPFIWNVAAVQGQIYGNRAFHNEVNVANLYNISYAGYNEMFTGTADPMVFSNDKINNRNRNIFEYLNNKDAYKGRIALFTSWDAFPYILNEERNGLPINSGYENVKEETRTEKMLNKVQDLSGEKKQTRPDMLTYVAAREYLGMHRPKVFFLGLGETDEYAHSEQYDMYLQKANEADHVISELWHWVQTTEGYKNNTTFIITTDHGRGKAGSSWTKHGTFVTGSSQTWLILFGKGVSPKGELMTQGRIYQQQLAQTIAHFAGENFGSQMPIDFAVK